VREATRADPPKGREAQCPLCWRIFSSDSSCEAHKPYRRPLTDTCKPPAHQGAQPFERRGLAVWYPKGAAPRSLPGHGTAQATQGH
jgi:hypothetical protein